MGLRLGGLGVDGVSQIDNVSIVKLIMAQALYYSAEAKNEGKSDACLEGIKYCTSERR